MKHALEANGLSETVDREAILAGNFLWLLSQNLILFHKYDFRKAGDILYTSHLTHFRILFFNRHPYVTGYTKTGLIAQNKILRNEQKL